MKFQYEIVPKLGGADQIGLRLKCISELQAEELHRAIRERFKATKLMPSHHGEYTHFVYVTSTEENLRQTWSSIEAAYLLNTSKVEADYSEQSAKAVQTFKSWQTQFRNILKQLNEDIPQPTSTVQSINPSRLEQQISQGQIVEAEERLLQQSSSGDGNALRALITLYTRTAKAAQIIELCSTKRDEILALPVSGRLVEQIVSAHLQEAQQENMPELMLSAQQIAQEFLPELERIRQADGVRRLLHQALKPQEPMEQVADATLSEQLAQLVKVEPGERIPQLEALKVKHPQSTSVLLDLAAAYTAVGEEDNALELYQSIPVKTEKDQDTVKVRQVELLLSGSRFKEVIDFLPEPIATLSSTLAGLKGAALYAMGQKSQARPLLERAWQAGERQYEILLPLARLWSAEGNPEDAAEIYLILLDIAPEHLSFEDRANIATLSSLGGFGDISDEQEVSYYEECIEVAGSRVATLPNAEDILKERAKLWKQLNRLDKFIIAYADWLDWLANQQQVDSLELELAHLRTIAASQQINRGQHFELLEGLEPYVALLPKLRSSLANEYQGIAIEEIDNAIRQGRSEEPFFQDLKRALYYLSPEIVPQLIEYQKQSKDEATKLGIQANSSEDSEETAPNLSSLRLALVGGHEATRREVIRELTSTYRIQEVVEVAPSSEAYISRSNVQSRISNCNLIVVITGYMGHDLSNIVSELQRDNALAGPVLPVACRGKSGVIREILRTVT